ncbi:MULTISPECIES: hypothetical protein [Photorhabdus]|uniref:Uncharacterized protein n=2 Tax=Photorhabdus asymbiotica TaxID=291112 RepID=B6VK63_PHOAA|nr:hypothetical protein [Photorhabdus asymbiotica]RKS66914.1 hypothetical protein BDD30_1262 [Photorhabdus asymbiotica]CAQ83115.1 conserved hypothetical protein [Photorhabdus asymbiotica]CAR66543.1 Conserved Hypothetical Protein [Photorhabdus asymbiotica subsp. asymbiotica ATCC 43949]
MIEKIDNIDALTALNSLKPTYIMSVSNYLPPDTMKLNVMPYDLPYHSFFVDVETTQVPPYGSLQIPLAGPMSERVDTILFTTMPVPSKGIARQNVWLFQDRYSNDNAIMYCVGDVFNYNNKQKAHGDPTGGGQRHMILTPEKNNIIVTLYKAL